MSCQNMIAGLPESLSMQVEELLLLYFIWQNFKERPTWGKKRQRKASSKVVIMAATEILIIFDSDLYFTYYCSSTMS